ncbi:MAG: hypothetical protein DI528_11130 [Shinella sp.]|nr:MAG: hypothetical protein DI528_11130 [Shinella sp.]
MAQIVTVSANTAAYAMEPIKPPQRVSRTTYVEEYARDVMDKAEESNDFRLRALANIAQPPALALFFLSAGQRRIEQSSVRETIEAYKNSTS